MQRCDGCPTSLSKFPVCENLVASFSVAGKTFSSDPRLLAERNSQNAPPNKPGLSSFPFSPHLPFKFYLVCLPLYFFIFCSTVLEMCFLISLSCFYPPTPTILEMEIFLVQILQHFQILIATKITDLVFTLKVLDLLIQSHPGHT